MDANLLSVLKRRLSVTSKQCCFCAVFFPVYRLTGLKQIIATEVVVLTQPFQFF